MRLIGRDIRVAFGANEVLKSVSVTVETGESLAVMGPSGSGKSTLLSVLGGLIRPSEGEVIYHHSGSARQFAWIFQNANVLPHRSAIDNVMFGAFRIGVNPDAARELGMQALDQIGMRWSANRRVGLLSGGERQRIAIAAALIGEPPILLADEPTAQLDQANAGLVTDAILRHSETTSVVVATHDPSVAHSCDRMIYLRNGLIHEE